MDIYKEIKEAIADMRRFLKNLDTHNNLQGRIFLENRINEIGRMMNQFFYQDKAEPIEYSEQLFRIIHEYRPVLNYIPVTDEYIRIYMLGQSLLHYLLTNYIYVSRRETHRITSFAMTLSKLLGGLPDPHKFFPSDKLSTISKRDFNIAYKLYDGICTVYGTAFTSAISVDEVSHREWMEKYFGYFSDLLVLLEFIPRNIKNSKNEVEQFASLDGLTTPIIYFIDMIGSVLSTYGGSFESYQSTLDHLHQLFERSKNIILEFYKSGQIPLNADPWKNNVFQLANHGFEHFLLKRKLIESYNLHFSEGHDFHSVIEKTAQIYDELKQLMRNQGYSVEHSPFTPVSQGVLVLLASLLTQEDRDRSIFFERVSDFGDKFESELFELRYMNALLMIQDCKEERIPYTDLERFLEKLSEIPQVLNSGRMTVVSLKEICALSLGSQSLGDTVNHLRDLLPSLGGDAQDVFSAFIENLIAMSNGTPFKSDINPFDPFTWVIPSFEWNGNKLVIPPFNSARSKRLGEYPRLQIAEPTFT